MAQSAALLYQDDASKIDYTPSGAVTVGQVVVLGSKAYIAPDAIAASALGALSGAGLWKVPKITGAIVAGNAIYWDSDADPVTGTAGSGAASLSGLGNTFMGPAVLAAASGDSYVQVSLGASPDRTAPILFKQSAATAETDAANAIAAADMINGIVVHTVSTGRTLTTPTGAAILAACPADITTGDAFYLRVITVGTGSDDISTLTAGDANVTFVGNVTVGPDASTFNGYGSWIFRYMGSSAFVGYRIG